MNSLFEYVDPSGATDEPTGLWTVRSPVVSFEAGASPADDAPVWRINLPGDAGAAEQAFRQAERRLEAARQALESTPDRIDEFIQRSGRGEGQVSFAVPEAGTPEAGLSALLDEYRRKGPGQVSFGIQEEAGGALDEARARFDTFMQSIDRDVLHFAWVETRVEDELLARTTVDWGGDSQTLYRAEITPIQISQHSQTLHLASISRSLKLRMVTTVAAGAVKLTTLLASGGGAVLALPMVYQYVTQILAQVKEYQALQ